MSPKTNENSRGISAVAKIETAKIRPSTVGQGGRRLWIYPERLSGPRSRRRSALALALVAFYLFAPYFSVDGRPFLRIDVLQGTGYFAGLTFRSSDAPLVVFILLALALALFLFTAIRGRIWCGYGCPQTVFLEWVIRPVETFIEGSASHRKILDAKRPRGGGVWVQKVAKHAIYLLVAAIVANSFLAFFVEPALLRIWIVSSPAGHPFAFGIMAAILLGFYFDFAWFREQFCSFLCPYARFQSVMIDRNTPVVSYDARRGELRGKGKEAGDCIDCGLCVRVCPTGIDIRNGLQLECIGCERCIDACDSIMANLKRPTGLVREASQTELEGGSRRLWRSRTIAYAICLILVVGALAFAVEQRLGVGITVVRQPGSPFVAYDEGRIANIFTIRLANNSSRATNGGIHLASGEEGLEIICGQCLESIDPFGERKMSFVVVVNPERFPRGGVRTVRFIHEASGETFSVPILLPAKG